MSSGKNLDSISTPLFTIVIKKGEQGDFIIEELEAHKGFNKLPTDVQDALINEFMIQLGEQPTHIVGGNLKSCN